MTLFENAALCVSCWPLEQQNRLLNDKQESALLPFAQYPTLEAMPLWDDPQFGVSSWPYYSLWICTLGVQNRTSHFTPTILLHIIQSTSQWARHTLYVLDYVLDSLVLVLPCSWWREALTSQSFCSGNQQWHSIWRRSWKALHNRHSCFSEHLIVERTKKMHEVSDCLGCCKSYWDKQVVCGLSNKST